MSTEAPRPSQVLARQLREMRERQRLTQQELAEEIVQRTGAPFDRVTVSVIESGKRNISLDEAFVLAAALGVRPANLFFPLDDAEDVQIYPGLKVSAADARLWLRGLRPIDLRVANTERGRRAWLSEVSSTDQTRLMRQALAGNLGVDDLRTAGVSDEALKAHDLDEEGEER
jgi:transcriptional regulator with XRE-family HTH domain